MRRLMTVALAGGVAGLAGWAMAGGYNDAGCGIGGLAFRDKDSRTAQILAATTNQYFGQTYSITTGTSGCSESGMARRRMELKNFVASNFRSLSRELASGQGEYARSFAGLMGCDGDASSRLLKLTKDNYGSLFKEGTTPETFLRDVDAQVSGDAALSSACTL